MHRDLKPTNVLLAVGQAFQPDPNGETGLMAGRTSHAHRVRLESLTYVPRIADFGLARQTNADSGQTRSGAIMGTPSYMAPEQAAGRVDNDETILARPAGSIERVVKWARRRPASAALIGVSVLATVLLAVGGVCFVKRLAKERNEAITARNNEAIQRDKAEQSAKDEALARRVAVHEQKNAEAAKKIAETERVQADAARPTAVIEKKQADEARTIAESEREKANVARDKTAAALKREQFTGYVQRLGLAHQELLADEVGRAKQILEQCPADLRHWEWRYLRHLCNTELIAFRGHANGFSPDLNRVAVAKFPKVTIYDVADGKEILSIDPHGDWNKKAASRPMVTSLAFSPDGKLLASIAHRHLTNETNKEPPGAVSV